MTALFDDRLFRRRYDRESYNCFHFVCELLSLLGMPVGYAAVAGGIRRKAKGPRREFVKTAKPRTGTICLFKSHGGEMHCGLFYQGRVLHIRESGVAWQPLHRVSPLFRRTAFYDLAGEKSPAQGGA